jgi:uncharacterized cupin superfamily protein
VKSGIWVCTPGGFDVRERANHEAVYIISGRVRIKDLVTGESRDLSSGDQLSLPKGSSVRWDIIETVTKFFVLSP